MSEIIEIAFCWYEQDEWEILKRSAADKEILDDTYEEWRSNANDAIKKVGAEGHHIRKINIKIGRLEAWCCEQGMENTSEARTQYAAHEASRRSLKSTLKA